LFFKSGFILTSLKIINGLIHASISLQQVTTVTFFPRSVSFK
jgi:hypothetical protein